MARLRFKGLTEYELKLSRLEKLTEEIAGRAIYEGAGIIADEIRKGIDSIPVVKGYGTASSPLPGGVTAVQKEGLRKGLGITPLEDDMGFYNVKIGFDGYNRTRTKEYPEGQPNQLVARGVESGTSWKQKHPFIRPAVTRSRARAERKMQERLDYEMKKIMD